MSPETLRTQKTFSLGRIVLGGLIAAGLIGGGVKVAEFNTVGAPSPSVTFVARDFVNAFVTATGSTTVKYPAACIQNPLLALASASGTVVRLTYENGNNPNAAAGDIGFVKGCGDSFGSGSTLFDNTCTGTGCVSAYTTGTASWNSADYIKFTLSKNPTAAFTARIRLQYEQRFGNH